MSSTPKAMPHNPDAEASTLGAIFLNWSSIEEVVTLLKAEDFFDARNQAIYSAMVSLYSKGAKGDLVTVIDELTKMGRLANAGGAAYVSSCTNTMPTSANIAYYADMVWQESTRRKLIKISSEVREDSYDESKDCRKILEETEQRIFSLSDDDNTEIQSMTKLVPSAVDLISKRVQCKGAATGVESGIDLLDSLTGGFQDSEFAVIGGRPSMGKTALALSMIENIAVNNKTSAGFLSLEMSATQTEMRLLSQISHVPGTALRKGFLKQDDMKRLADAADRLYEAPLYMCDKANMRLLEVKSVARRMVAKFGVKIIFIDYMGLIGCERDDRPVYEQQSMVSKALKGLARELEIPIVALCQVARSAEGSRPSLAELRGSGSIEQDADTVIFIHGERSGRKSDDDAPPPPVQERKLILAKQRNGPVGEVDVSYVARFTKFENKRNTQ